MKYKVWKVFTIGAFEKEEKWLNQMSAKGLDLVQVGFLNYTFEDGVPGEYTYRLELLENMPSHAESVKYLEFLKETNIEHVASIFRWVYLRKKKSDGVFELYSDLRSKLNHFNRIKLLGLIVSLLTTTQLITNIIQIIINYNDYVDITVHAALAVLMLVFTIFIHIMMVPVYRAVRQLKNDIKIHEQ